jgi:hypothetical protein
MDCFVLVRPESINQEPEKKPHQISFGDLKPEFRELFEKFRSRTLENPRIKTLNGRPMNGEQLLGFSKIIISWINEGKTPNIRSTVDQVDAIFCKGA